MGLTSIFDERFGFASATDCICKPANHILAEAKILLGGRRVFVWMEGGF